jgi:hypothetical protein
VKRLLVRKKNILLLFILGLRHHDFSSKCAYGEKIYFSLFLSQKCGADDFYNNNLLFVYLVTLYSINLHLFTKKPQALLKQNHFLGLILLEG